MTSFPHDESGRRHRLVVCFSRSRRPAVNPRAEFVNASLHYKTPSSRTSTLGEATTGEAGAQEETPTGADQHAGAVAELSRCPLLVLGEGRHRPPGSALP